MKPPQSVSLTTCTLVWMGLAISNYLGILFSTTTAHEANERTFFQLTAIVVVYLASRISKKEW